MHLYIICMCAGPTGGCGIMIWAGIVGDKLIGPFFNIIFQIDCFDNHF